MKTDVIRLRPLRREDSTQFYKWITDRELLTFNAPYKPVSEIEHDEWIEKMLLENTNTELFVIEHIPNETAIGSCQLLNIDDIHRRAELQIRIGEEEYRGKGFGTKAVKKLLYFAFNDLNLHRVQLYVFQTNERAISAYENCGFRREGILLEAVYIDGAYLDVVVMGILESEFKD